MSVRKIVAGSLVGLLCLSTMPSTAQALTIARVTRHGYIMVDEPDAIVPYEGRAPQNNTQDTFAIISEITRIISETPGAPRGRYIAVMQTVNERSVLAYYLGIRNDTRGIGQRSPINNRDEIYDLNRFADTAYPVTGFVFLNTYQYYSMDGFNDFGKYLICTQEFGHRFGTFVRNPPQPGEVAPVDAGVVDAGDAGDAGDPSDAETPDASVDAGAVVDVPNPPPMGPDLMPTALLGRQTAHWSYFVHTGGSPMEGNNWNELMPGVFRTSRPSFKFHPMDLYIMGLMAPRDVTPVYLIAEPDIMNQQDMGGARINPASGPEYGGRMVSIRGRRVDVTIDDIIRANGPRIPAAVTVPPSNGDAGVGDAGTAIRPGDLDVVWVLLTTQERVGDFLARDFDRAIETCGDGYAFATEGRSVLVPQVAAQVTDSGVVVDASEAGPDTGTAPTDVTTDGGTDAGTQEFRIGGGCACRTTIGTTSQQSRAPWQGLVFTLASLALSTTIRHKKSKRN